MKNHGGKRANSGAKQKFGEEGVYLQTLVPKSKKELLKKKFNKIVEPYKK